MMEKDKILQLMLEMSESGKQLEQAIGSFGTSYESFVQDKVC